MFHTVFQRDQRPPGQMHHPMHNSVATYWTETFQKREMKHEFSDELFLNNIHLIPDPLKKNLADTLFNTEVPINTEKVHLKPDKMALNDQKVPLENMSVENPPKHGGTTFSGIGSFFSGVMNILTNVVFRARSPNYYDCFDVDSHQGSYNWQLARTDVQDKNGRADDRDDFDAPSNPNVSSDMNFDSRAAVTSCESKLNQVLHLLTPKQTSNPVWVRKRPKKAFVEPGSVSESFEDAFSPEDFSSLPDDSFVEYYSPLQYHCEDLCQSAALKTQINTAPVKQNTDNLQDVPNKSELDFKVVQLEGNQIQPEKDTTILDTDKMLSEKSILNSSKEPDAKTPTELETTKSESSSTKEQLVSSCEDKLSKLKAILLEKRNKCRTKQHISETRTTPPKEIPSEKKPADKHFKNPHRRSSKRGKSKLKCRIEDDLMFANEISLGTPPSAENSPAQHNVNFGDYFDEISGRFRTASTGSDDSFQIVFNECLNTGRVRKFSDCDSEDSFIVFEDSPDCYVSNDVFDSDSESEVSDSGCGITCKLAHTLTRTISNLADDSLYAESEDEVDFGVKCDITNTGLELEDSCLVHEKTALDAAPTALVEKNTGLLLDDKKKLLRKSQPTKKVQFSSAPPKVHVMRVWAFAARQARAGHWERYAVDRERFKRRIADMDMALSWVLKPQHRRRVMFQRFMPWWNQLKRKELADKKEREELEKRQEEERQRCEDEKKKLEANDKLAIEKEDPTNQFVQTETIDVENDQKETASMLVKQDKIRDSIEFRQENNDMLVKQDKIRGSIEFRQENNDMLVKQDKIRGSIEFRQENNDMLVKQDKIRGSIEFRQENNDMLVKQDKIRGSIEFRQENNDKKDEDNDRTMSTEKVFLETQNPSNKNILSHINKESLESNNNKTQFKSDNSIASDLIISDSALAKKIQELEDDNKNKYEVVS